MRGASGLLWLALLLAPAPVLADAAAGQALFQRRCANCHAVGPGVQSGFGPQLNALFGRPAGSLPSYRYSPAMQQAGFTWDRERLTAFLRDPDAVVPDTKMRFWGIGDADDLRDLADFLATQVPPQPK